MRLLLSMGLKPGADPGEPLRPRLRLVDADDGRVVRELAPEPAPPHRPGEHHELTGSTLDGDRLWQATRTEVLRVDLARWRIEARWSHPLLYDVHSVVPGPDGRLAVTASGHESVLEMSPAGELLRHRWLRRGSFERAYPGVSDFRAVPFDRFKPHSHHPNRAFWLGDRLWVTLFEQRECRCLDGPGAVPLPEGPPHDGLLREGLLWFTTVNGHVVAVDPDTLERRVHVDLAVLCGPGLPGWCRGLDVVGSRLWVGMTTLRSTTHREVLRRVLRGRDGVKRPTRVLEVDLDGPRVVREVPVGNRAGGTIYAVHALDGDQSQAA